LRFGVELPAGRFVRNGFFANKFKGDDAREGGVPRTVDNTHATYRHQLSELVTAESPSRLWRIAGQFGRCYSDLTPKSIRLHQKEESRVARELTNGELQEEAQCNISQGSLRAIPDSLTEASGRKPVGRAYQDDIKPRDLYVSPTQAHCLAQSRVRAHSRRVNGRVHYSSRRQILTPDFTKDAPAAEMSVQMTPSAGLFHSDKPIHFFSSRSFALLGTKTEIVRFWHNLRGPRKPVRREDTRKAKRAALYVRVSSGEQNTGAQERAVRELCPRRGWKMLQI